VIGEVRVVDDVPSAFAEIVAGEIARVLGGADAPEHFRIGCSGSSSGSRCFSRLAEVDDLPWERLACYFVDERCVPADSPDSNQRTLREALAPRRDRLAGFAPMDCTAGPAAYEELLSRDGDYHLAQLGLGPDGHTASLFPRSAGLDAAADRLVIGNVDPSGLNVHPRLSLTFGALARIPRLVMTVMGADKAEVLAAVDAGDDLPASHVDSSSVLWLCDPAAAAGLGSRRQ
jgi:6-phosphogluconolactonase/glucosamine-6-phosphate isomerase/deaminase